jgi:phospholipid/cholesterol/gamma-HCH transport system substrate-binding protein
MSRELKLGLLSLIIIITALWGYQYIKGKNILNTVRTYSVVYGNVEGLEVAAPVEINGFSVGSIQKIGLNPEDVKSMLVTFEVEGDYSFPKSTEASLSTSNSLVGSKKIVLLFDDLCQIDCLQDGDQMISSTRGILETILPKEDLKDHLSILRGEIGGIMDSVMTAANGEDADNSFARSLRNMEESMQNLASLTATMDRFTKSTYSDLETTISHMANITASLEKSSEEIKSIMDNVNTISGQVAEADLGATINKTDETFDKTNALLTDLQSSVAQVNGSFTKIDGILSDIEKGEGTIGKFMKDDALYHNLNLLMQDFRLHPKRYVRFSVFGRKGNAYGYPEGDPALDQSKKEGIKKKE